MSKERIHTSARFHLSAHYVGESIDLKGIQEGFKRFPFINRDHPLVVEYARRQYVAFTKFGVVVFWNVPDEGRKEILSELTPYVRAKHASYEYRETANVFERDDKEEVTSEGIFLNALDTGRIKIVSYAIAQSVALERYELDIEKNFGELGVVIENLKNKGKALLKEKDLLKQVGRALAVKQTAISHLSLFDKPDEVWESPELEKLYLRLRVEFDIEDRFSVLDEKSGFLSENTRMLMEFLADKKAAFLETVIIVLILIEIIPLVIEWVQYWRQ